MSNAPKPERPNTLAGLVAKHQELVTLRERYHDQIRKLTVDIDHLDAAIRLFDGTVDRPVLGEYVTRIYDQVRARPLYLVDRRVNVPASVRLRAEAGDGDDDDGSRMAA